MGEKLQTTPNNTLDSPDRVTLGLLNFRAGGLRREISRTQFTRTHDFAPLAQAVSVDGANEIDILVLCEGKEWNVDGEQPLHLATNVLSETLNRTYVGRTGFLGRGNFPPVVIYDPNKLDLRSWHGNSTDPIDKRNLANFEIKGENGGKFMVSAQHWNPWSGDHRLEEDAKPLGQYGSSKTPVIIAGDLNGTASGLHLPEFTERNFPPHKLTEKGLRGPDTVWEADTRAVDHLIGEWDNTLQRRNGGCGFFAVPELAHRTGTPPDDAFRPTVNRGGSGLLIDWILVNRVLEPSYVPGSYGVHVPESDPPPSDHRLVVASFDIPKRRVFRV